MTSIIIIIACIVMSAYFSGTETAFLSFNKTKMKSLAEKGNKRAKTVLKLSDRYDKLISTILIGNNIVNILASSLATVLFIQLLGDDLGPTVSTAVLTVLILIFGEITPKNLAKDFADPFAKFSAPIIQLLSWILYPVTLIFTGWKKILGLIFKPKEEEKMSQEELLMLVDELQQGESIDNTEGNLLRSTIEFTERRAEDILTHRMDLEAVPTTATKEEIATKFAETQFSRLLVYEESIDNVVGIIHQKDLYTAQGLTGRKISELISPPVFIQRSEKINDLLKKLQKEKTHIAVVLDDYGGTLGIVTMEDILEELVGDIWDEHDEVVEPILKISDDTYTVDCSVDFDEFCKFFGIEEETEAVSTSGFIMDLFDKVPDENESCEYNGLTITVRETDFHRIAKVEIKVTEPLPSDEEEAEEKEEANV